jgi:hypothetical protein
MGNSGIPKNLRSRMPDQSDLILPKKEKESVFQESVGFADVIMNTNINTKRSTISNVYMSNKKSLPISRPDDNDEK